MQSRRCAHRAQVIVALLVLACLSACGNGDGKDSAGPPAEPLGFDSPDAVYDAMLKAVKARDTQTFRRLLAKNAGEVNRFDDGATELMADVGSREKAEAKLIESFEYFSFRHTLEERARRYRPVVDGDRAIVIAAYTDRITGVTAHDVVTFRRIDGTWFFHALEGDDATWLTQQTRDLEAVYPPAETPSHAPSDGPVKPADE